MSYLSEQEEILKKKIIPQDAKEDFEAFWRSNVQWLRTIPLQIKRKKLVTPYDKTVTTWEISYNTHDDTWIDAWFSYPTAKEGGRNMLLKITDPRLLETTGGIVQGMSGSPIVQNGMLVGAVTHVFVNDPQQGYAIFAETMIETAEELEQKLADNAA